MLPADDCWEVRRGGRAAAEDRAERAHPAAGLEAGAGGGAAAASHLQGVPARTADGDREERCV